MVSERLRDHIHDGYHTMRNGIGLLGFIFPFIILGWGFFVDRVAPLDSLSAYYFTSARNVYVGYLCTIGFCLHIYKGYSSDKDIGFLPNENWALNFAGVFAMLTAFIATSPPESLSASQSLCVPEYDLSQLHTACALLFFLCIGYVCTFRATDTLKDFNDPELLKKYQWKYVTLGFGMGTLAIAVALLNLASSKPYYLVLGGEMFGVWIFSYYWILKAGEMKELDDKLSNKT